VGFFSWDPQTPQTTWRESLRSIEALACHLILSSRRPELRRGKIFRLARGSFDIAFGGFAAAVLHVIETAPCSC